MKKSKENYLKYVPIVPPTIQDSSKNNSNLIFRDIDLKLISLKHKTLNYIWSKFNQISLNGFWEINQTILPN